MLETQSPRLLSGACHIGTLSPPKSQAPRSKADVHNKAHFYTNSLGILVEQNAELQAHRATFSLDTTGNISKAKYSDLSAKADPGAGSSKGPSNDGCLRLARSLLHHHLVEKSCSVFL